MTCEICEDIGYVAKDGRDVMCRCMIIAGIRAEIRRYPELRDITLLDGLVIQKRDPIHGSQIIRSKWDEFRRHLLGWMWASHLRGARPKLLITTDIDLRSRWLGKSDGSSESYSTLSSLGEFDLVVVKIHRVKHGATPQALLEAAAYAPQIWFVHDVNDTLNPKHSSWSDDLEEQFGDQRLDLVVNKPVQAEKGHVLEVLGLAAKKEVYDA